MTAFLFPGQGSQFVGMGQDLHAAFASVRDLYSEAADILGFDLAKISFDGPEEELRQTNVTQPALFVHSIAVDRLIKERGVHPAAAAGHSLGEFSAAVSAGALTFAGALGVVKVRAEQMKLAGAQTPGTMAAIMGASPGQIEEICRVASKTGVVVPANLNSPGQVVISGAVAAVEKAVATARDLGIRRAMMLKVSGAFHSPLMTPAREALRAALDQAQIARPEVPLYQNVTASPESDPAVIRKNLLAQLENPVRWEETIHRFVTDGQTEFVEVGAGKALQGLNRRIEPEAAIFGLCSLVDLDKLND